MSTSTKNLNLVKPESSDYFDVSTFNQNMDTIDTAIEALQSQQASSIADLSAKIDSLVSVCSAIQTRVNSIPTSKTTCSYSATTVNSIKSTVESILSKVNAMSSSGGSDSDKVLKLLKAFVVEWYSTSYSDSFGKKIYFANINKSGSSIISSVGV